MHAFEKIFPADDFALLALILVMPLLGAFVNGIFGKRLGRDAVRLMALSALGISFLGSVLAFFLLPVVFTMWVTTEGAGVGLPNVMPEAREPSGA